MSAQPNEPASTGEQSFYQARHKIHPKSVTGRFATWRWALVWFTQLVFFGLCWIEWNGRQAVLFDIAERKFYLFGLIFWPQDVFFLAILLIISAFALFLFTAVAGRLWCGYACPQTVYTEIFMWIEEKIEGDRNARIKLDKAPMDGRKLRMRAAKYGIWILFSLWTGFTFVGYFTPIKTLWGELTTLSLGPWQWFWFLFYATFTYTFAGHLREQVCTYMCPYARFQGVMFDADTLVITYDPERGERRGSRSKKADYKTQGLGDCIDCAMCVNVCPTGIDIRDGLQMECIACAACIDACDQVMDKMNYPQGLIRYSTENAMARHWSGKDILRHILRPRILIYASLLGAICMAFIWGLATKTTLRVDVIRDRATLAREVEDGLIENVYQLRVMNVSEKTGQYTVAATGLDGISVVSEAAFEVPPATTKAVTLRLRVPPDSGKRGSNVIHIEVRSVTDEKVGVREKASFIVP